MKRRIDIDKIRHRGERIVIQISLQTHRGTQFYRKKPTKTVPGYDNPVNVNLFNAKNGITLKSVRCPEWNSIDRILYVRGYARDRDFSEIPLRTHEYDLVVQAIKEYNEIENVPFDIILNNDLFKLE